MPQTFSSKLKCTHCSSSYVEAFTISSMYPFKPPLFVPSTYTPLCTHKSSSRVLSYLFSMLSLSISLVVNLLVSSNFCHPSPLAIMSSSWLGTLPNVLCCQMTSAQHTCVSIVFLSYHWLGEPCARKSHPKKYKVCICNLSTYIKHCNTHNNWQIPNTSMTSLEFSWSYIWIYFSLSCHTQGFHIHFLFTYTIAMKAKTSSLVVDTLSLFIMLLE